MKSILVFALFIALSSQSMFMDMSKPAFDHSLGLTGNASNLQSYFDGLWGFYGLDQSDAANCFNDVSATSYFNYMGYFYQYMGALMNGQRTNAALYFGLMQALNTTLGPAIECLYGTQDFLLLMYNAGVTNFNLTLFNILQGVYFEGRFDDYYLAWNPVYTLLYNRQYNEAGYTYGPILYDQINNASSSEVWINAIQAFQNALFFDYNITSPTEFSDCYNDNTAHSEIVFYFLWSQTVANSTVANVASNTQAWFNTTGRDLMEQFIPVIGCLDRTNDQVRLDQAVGTQLNSPAWREATENFINNNPATYYAIFNQMYNEFKSYNPGYAGFAYGTFIYAVNASIASSASA